MEEVNKIHQIIQSYCHNPFWNDNFSGFEPETIQWLNQVIEEDAVQVKTTPNSSWLKEVQEILKDYQEFIQTDGHKARMASEMAFMFLVEKLKIVT